MLILNYSHKVHYNVNLIAMKCCKCLQRCGQMMCCQCYKTIKELNNEKNRVIVMKKEQLQGQLGTMKQLNQSFERKIEIQKKKVVQLAKIKQYHNRIKLKTQRNAIISKKYEQLQTQFNRIEKNIKQVQNNSQMIDSKIKMATKKVIVAKQQKQQLKQQIVNIMNSKFRQTSKYVTFDQVQQMEEGQWNHYVIEEGLQNLQPSISKPQKKQLALMSTQTTNIVSILGGFDENKQKVLKYFERSIKIVKVLSHIYGIQLPYRINSAQFKNRLSLRRAILNEGNNKIFNYALLRRHQANTIYLYSRGCMTVFYPDIEQGRLQDLHEAMINRLKGYNMRPMSSQFIKIPFIDELVVANIVQHFCSNLPDPVQQQVEAEQTYIDIVDFNFEEQQEQDLIELLI